MDKQDSNIKSQFEKSSPLDPSLAPTDPYDWLPARPDKVVEYLEAYAGQSENPKFGINSEQPFFVYWDPPSPPSPHDPIVPDEAFVGKSGAGLYGDFVLEVDHYIGSMLNALDRLNLAENTMVVFASDNGPATGVYERVEEFDHYSMGERRGMKTDVLEGGHRVPLVVRWPGFIEPDQRSEELVSLTDRLATIAEITGQRIPANGGEESLSFLPLLRNERLEKPCRESVIYHPLKGTFAIRSRNWVFIDVGTAPASEPDWFLELRNVEANRFPGQLYHLDDDPMQAINLYG